MPPNSTSKNSQWIAGMAALTGSSPSLEISDVGITCSLRGLGSRAAPSHGTKGAKTVEPPSRDKEIRHLRQAGMWQAQTRTEPGGLPVSAGMIDRWLSAHAYGGTMSELGDDSR